MVHKTWCCNNWQESRDCLLHVLLRCSICRWIWIIRGYTVYNNNISKSYFQDVCEPNFCLIPPVWDTCVTTRLRRTTPSPRPVLHTKKCCSFINFGLHHYQLTKWLLAVPLHTYLPSTCSLLMHIVCCSFVCLFVVVFVFYYSYSCCICLLFGPRGHKDVNKLIDWLIDWLIDCEECWEHDM